MPRVLFVFVDGVGLGDDDASYNVCCTAALPVLQQLLDGGMLVRAAAPHHGAAASLIGIDATLGVAGTPQSGTGQAALLTGVNAAELHGRHFGPWVPAQLQPLVRAQSVLARARAAGRRVAFANAYPEEVLLRDVALPSDDVARSAMSRQHSRRGAAFLRAGPPLAALGAGVLNRHTPALERGDAVASEMTNDGWREHLGRTSVPVIDAAQAGRNLARIAGEHDLTLFAHYATDYAGHRRDAVATRDALERCDSFLGGVVADMADDMLLIVASDHGNIEDLRVGHTRNPALGLVVGEGHAAVARGLHALTDVTPAILRCLRV